MALTNETCVKSSISLQAYNVFNTYAHEIYGWKIISIIIGGTNGDLQSDLSTLKFKNGEKLKISEHNYHNSTVN